MTTDWTAETIAALTDYSVCPRCGARPLSSGICRTCRADLTGPVAVELVAATAAAVAAIEARGAVIARVPSVPAAVPAPAPAPPVSPAPAPSTVAPRASSQLSLQSVLAVAGAGLVAIAALVFTFTAGIDPVGRNVIIAITTALFLGAAVLLARVKLQFSAETVGALGMVFVALDVRSVASGAGVGLDPWTAAAIATLVAAAIMVGIALLASIRTWLWTGLVGIVLVPAFFGYGAGDSWYSIVGHLAAAFVALGLGAGIRTLAARFAGTLGTDRATMTVLRFAIVLIVLCQLLVLTPPAPLDRSLTAAAVIAVIAVLAALSSLDSLSRLWSTIAGVAATVAAALIPFSFLVNTSSEWMFALVPLAALLALVALSALAQLCIGATRLNRGYLLAGAWATTIIAAVPAGLVGLGQILIVGSSAFDNSGSVFDNIVGLSALIGIAVAAVAGAVVAVLIPRIVGLAGNGFRLAGTVSVAWFGMYLALVLTAWSALTIETQLAIGIGLAVLASILITRVPVLAAWPLRLRLPIVLMAHVLLVHAIVQSLTDPLVLVIAGVAIVAAILVLALPVERSLRPVHVGIAFAYALWVFARALGEFTILEDVATFALTATLALLAAIAATLIAHLRRGYWYAILLVAVVPFAIAIAWVIAERSGWSAIPATLAAVLGVLLLSSRRPGTLAALRFIGAALIVPSLAVITITLGAQLLDGSGSPVVLPIVAGIVAVILPATVAIGRWLESLGIEARQAHTSRLVIEASALVTAGVAVLLSLARIAAGFETAFVVLAIVGIGGAATAVFSGRRYGWVIAYTAWSAALWCLFALWDIGVVEPYVLPPALAAVVIGAVGVLRGKPGRWMVIVGLVVSAIPSLVQLALDDSDPVATAWRLWGLLAASIVLLVVGFMLPRLHRLASLRLPVLGSAMLAAAAGAIHAITLGIGLPATYIGQADDAILPVVGLALLAAVLAGAAAQLIATPGNRWLFTPALAYLVIGPVVAIRTSEVSIWMLFALMVGLLAAMIVVTVRTRSGGPTTAPPVWLLFVFAWIAGVASWSQREVLRVEGYSLPMGVALLLVGLIAWRSQELPATTTSWPIGFSGSWALFGPGLFVLFAPSILATATDPRTERAVLVIVLALASILLGSRLKLAAPFLLGIAVLPLENIMVFAVQSMRGIESTPWWITLASAGAVLLVIAVSSERRTTGGGIAARIRDLK